MIAIDIPDFGSLRLEHLLFDFNGTLAVDGELVEGVAERLRALSSKLSIHVVTADTFGRVRQELAQLPCDIQVLPEEDQAGAKAKLLRSLGAEATAAFGNGRNDRLMLREAALGIAVILSEGTSSASLQAADVVCTSITDALDLLEHPLRLVATLRS